MIVVAIDRSSFDNKAIGNSVALGAETTAKLISLSQGHILKIFIDDDGGKKEKSKIVASRALINPNVIAVLGHSTSAITLDVLHIYGSQKMPFFLPVATSTQITNKGWKNVFRLVPSNEVQASEVASFLESKSFKSVQLIYDSSDYGYDLGEKIKQQLSTKLIKSEKPTIIPEKSNKFDLKVSKDSDAIIFAGYYKQCGAIVKEIRKLGITKPIILTDGCFPDEIFEYMGNNAGQIYISFVAPDWKNIKNSKKFLDQLSANDAGKKSDYSFAPFASDGIRIIADTCNEIISNNEPINRENLLKYLEKKRNTDIKDGLVSGSYNFNGNGENTNARSYIYELIQNKAKERGWKLVNKVKVSK
jgi:branched-chain amino acid transport system substrate-binding protein